jgi:O-antigen/teichoic acid export membrane protein
MRQTGIIRHTRLSPLWLVFIALAVAPFALTGRTNSVVFAVVVWAVVALLLVRWWRHRNDPRPPNHAV